MTLDTQCEEEREQSKRCCRKWCSKRGEGQGGGGCCPGRRRYYNFAMRLEDWILKRSIAISFILGLSLIGFGLMDFFVNSPILQGKNSIGGRYMINVGLGELYLWVIRLQANERTCT